MPSGVLSLRSETHGGARSSARSHGMGDIDIAPSNSHITATSLLGFDGLGPNPWSRTTGSPRSSGERPRAQNACGPFSIKDQPQLRTRVAPSVSHNPVTRRNGRMHAMPAPGFESPLNRISRTGEDTTPAFMPIDLKYPSARAFSRGRYRRCVSSRLPRYTRQ